MKNIIMTVLSYGNNQFYVPWMTSQYEKALAENYRRILKHGRTSNIKKLNHTKKS